MIAALLSLAGCGGLDAVASDASPLSLRRPFAPRATRIIPALPRRSYLVTIEAIGFETSVEIQSGGTTLAAVCGAGLEARSRSALAAQTERCTYRVPDGGTITVRSIVPDATAFTEIIRGPMSCSVLPNSFEATLKCTRTVHGPITQSIGWSAPGVPDQLVPVTLQAGPDTSVNVTVWSYTSWGVWADTAICEDSTCTVWVPVGSDLYAETTEPSWAWSGRVQIGGVTCIDEPNSFNDLPCGEFYCADDIPSDEIYGDGPESIACSGTVTRPETLLFEWRYEACRFGRSGLVELTADHAAIDYRIEDFSYMSPQPDEFGTCGSASTVETCDVSIEICGATTFRMAPSPEVPVLPPELACSTDAATGDFVCVLRPDSWIWAPPQGPWAVTMGYLAP